MIVNKNVCLYQKVLAGCQIMYNLWSGGPSSLIFERQLQISIADYFALPPPLPPTKEEQHLIKVSKHKIVQTYMYFQRKDHTG